MLNIFNAGAEIFQQMLFSKKGSKKCQGLPISTIIIIILVIIVLAAVGIFFFMQFGTGAMQAGAGTDIAGTGIKNLTEHAGDVI